jgi:hypothetical protein
MLTSIVEPTMRGNVAKEANWIGTSRREEENESRVETTVETPRIGVTTEKNVTRRI